jgi:hypothetical protein
VTDIVERLRRIDYEWSVTTTCHEAADEIERLRGLLTAWVLAFDESDYPETMVEKVSYGSDTGIGTEKSLAFRTNEALGRVPKPF